MLSHKDVLLRCKERVLRTGETLVKNEHGYNSWIICMNDC